MPFQVTSPEGVHEPTPPIFVWTPRDLRAYRNARDAETYLEATDVASGYYEAAFDAEGRGLVLGTRRERRKAFFLPFWLDFVQIRLDDRGPRPQEFRLILMEFLQSCGSSPQELEGCSWGELVGLAATASEKVRRDNLLFKGWGAKEK